ncbi:hypothetical protein PMAYCL1PPCAC_18301 [Pristionchus mayeri]|uniref:RING-type domain-containing protein n=1 Tax=Pristionchus mayeri TaxID=1317129 RepID=A0AAN5I1W9_9BILA|nr:hypothetical protein PMAYCL1PPCAC_18301 [Pristionchus mayeri]
MNRVHHGPKLEFALITSLLGRQDGPSTRRAGLVDDEVQSQAILDENTPHIQVIESEDSDDDIQLITRKRSRIDLEGVKGPDSEPSISHDDDSEDHCSICFDAFTSSGNHRLVSLRCGHFFGEDCIKRWISSESGKACPTCKKSAKLKDLRNHFVASIKAVDNSEAESLRQSLVAFQRENEGLRLENVSLKKQIEEIKRNGSSLQSTTPTWTVHSSFFLQRKHTYILSKEEGSRAFDLNGERIVVSVKLASSPISEGFGITILDANLRPIGEKFGISNRRIRTIEFCPFDAAVYLVGGEDGWLMVRSVDGGIRKRVAVPAPVWSSCWTCNNKATIGLSNGRIMELNTDDMSLNDIIQWDSRIGITQIVKLDKLFSLVIVSLKSIRVVRHGRITSHLEEEIRSKGKILDVSVFASHNSFVVSFPSSDGSIHKLCRLSVDTDDNVEVITVSEFKSPSKSFSYLWKNVLFFFGGSLTSAIFQEDFKRIVVHDWSESKEDKFLTVGSSKITHLRAVSSSASESSHILALAEKELHLLQLSLAK